MLLFVEGGNILFLFYLYIEMGWVGNFFFFFDMKTGSLSDCLHLFFTSFLLPDIFAAEKQGNITAQNTGSKTLSVTFFQFFHR